MAFKKNYNSLLPDDFVLSEEFESIVEQLENTKDHFYITGKAGSGKSTLLAYFRSVTQKNTAVLAPTGVAAIRRNNFFFFHCHNRSLEFFYIAIV